MGSHSVIYATRQRWPPCLHPNWAGWYSIYRPRKGPFIATQLNSTRRRVEFSWIELRRYRHPHRRNSTVAGDRQCNWPGCSVQPISAKQVRVELSCVTDATQLNSTSNYNRFWDTAIYWSKIVILSYPLAFDAPVRYVVPVGILAPPLVWKNYNGVATRWWKKFEDMFIRFDVIHERDRRTDRRTLHDSKVCKDRAYASHRAVKTR